jgi:putative inorganic carbon (HCO3(-)) transporter
MRYFSRMSATIIRWEPLLILAAAPLLLLPSPRRAWALAVIPLVWAMIWVAGRMPLAATPLNAPVLLLWIMVLVSLWATYDVEQSLGRIAGMVLGLGIFALVGREARKSSGQVFWLMAYLLSGLGLSGLALFGTRWLRKFPILEGITSRLPPRLDAFLGEEGIFHPNIVAGALLWVLPLVLLLAMFAVTHVPLLTRHVGTKKTFGLNILLLITAAFMSGVFLLTQSREAFIGLGVSMSVIGFPFAFALRNNSQASLKPLALGLFLVLMLAVMAVLRVGPIAAMEFVFGGTQPGEGALSISSLSSRLEIWSRALYAIQDFAFTGIGMGTFQPIVRALYPLFTISPEVEFVHPHNHLLSAAVDLGLPGLVAYLSLYLSAGWMLLRIFQRAGSPWTRTLALGYGASFLAYFIYGLTDAIALGTKPGVFFWYMLGLVAALYGKTTIGNSAIMSAGSS